MIGRVSKLAFTFRGPFINEFFVCVASYVLVDELDCLVFRVVPSAKVNCVKLVFWFCVAGQLLVSVGLIKMTNRKCAL